MALIGNPNAGKTTLFNTLTGARAKVGKYPGITVERREGQLDLPDGSAAQLVDIPGAYSLSARTAEEQVAITAIAGLNPFADPDCVIVVVDSTQLARNLYLALLVCTTIGISASFWVLFVYVLQVSSVRSRLLAAAKWVNRLLGSVLIALGLRLWLAEAPG